jgi:peptidoglycan hydrolase-like protein with peptidoglycan-binding domain
MLRSFRTIVLAIAALLIAPPVARAATPPPGYHSLDGARHGAYLRYGSQGEAVKALQRVLVDLGFGVGVTGYFGTYTDAAVRGFQRREGLAVDGIVGPQTVAAFDRAYGIAGSGTGTGTAPGSGTIATGIPPRSSWMMTGSEFIDRTRGFSRAQREAAILQEIAQGDIPDFERRFVDVTVIMSGPDFRPHWATYRVLPDYLAIGPDWDFVRMPMSPLTAQKIADVFGCSLPTRKMVNDVWRAAAIELAPIPMTPGPAMMSNDYFEEHNRRIEAQLAGAPRGALVAGHKKDVVISNRLFANPGRVAIYGWHWPNGRPIQPLSTVHENTYADYSHGIRLVEATAIVDGRTVAIADLLRDPVLSALVSDEGPLALTRQPGVP